ncbi:MAG: ThiF family adenylyltransferase [Myxococcota bacterium]|nr:ThiF family adenylyltransferase [Myxococcota bacterium]
MDLPELTPDEIARYSRHLLLDEVGMEGQRRLKGGSVLCVGAGGLGSPLLLYLAAAGVGRIGIVDFDVVELSNLQRQVIHGTSSVGQPKLLSARRRILEINPNCQVDLYEEALTIDNALEILAPYDVVVDGTDNFPTRYLVNDACVILGKPNVYGAIFKFEGQASVFNHTGGWVRPESWDSLSPEQRRSLSDAWILEPHERGPDYRDLYPEAPPADLAPSCAEGGVLGILPGVIGCIQATETLKILLGRGDTLSGRLLLYDALKMRFTEVKVMRDPARPPIEHLVDTGTFCGMPEPAVGEGFERWSVGRIRDRLQAGWKPWVLDVRKPAEAEIVRLPWADALIPHDELSGRLDAVPRDRDILVHCKLGGRSARAAAVLAQAGYATVVNMEGGIVDWARQVDPSLPTY